MKPILLLLALFVSMPAFASMPGETFIVDGTVEYTVKPAGDGCSFTPDNGVVNAEFVFSETGCASILTAIKHVRIGAGEQSVHDGSYWVQVKPGITPGRIKITPATTEFSPSVSASESLEAAFEHAIANANAQ